MPKLRAPHRGRGMTTRIKRECHHKQSRHEHGTRLAYIRDKCRCTECTAAASKDEDRRNRLIAYGRYDVGRVDAAPVREYTLSLMAYGIGMKRIAHIAGVSNSTLGKILYGSEAQGIKPRARVAKHVAEKVMKVKPELQHLGKTALVEASGTRRRIQALVVIGWSKARLARQLGMAPSNFNKTLNSETVHAETARKVQALYDQLWNQPQYGHDHRSRISANASRNRAKAKGWAPPLAWDDETIDDPNATPDMGQEAGFIHAEERMETIEFLLETGCGQAELIRRSGYKNLVALEQACHRQGRRDLIAKVKHIRDMERAAA